MGMLTELLLHLATPHSLVGNGQEKRYLDIPPMVRMLFHFDETGNCVTIRNYIIMHCRLNKIGNIFLKPQRKETEKKTNFQ